MLGDNVRLLRKERGMSVNKLSKVSGVSLGFISDIENDKTNPSIPTLEKIAKALDVKVELFFKEDLAETIGKPVTQEKIREWDNSLDKITTQEEKIKYLESIVDFADPKEAVQFLLKQPSIMGFGGFDVNQMSDDEVVEFANELLRQLKLISYKYKK
ncbi:helix-turn-helix transcriptional regulator [Haloimpatiens massiliensis]|uniref:helix-turn-helix domain-containing protein n=1 Tax=Haloimpatiens massiliensis TaxID=1658110 RepID=UPI00311961B3